MSKHFQIFWFHLETNFQSVLEVSSPEEPVPWPWPKAWQMLSLPWGDWARSLAAVSG